MKRIELYIILIIVGLLMLSSTLMYLKTKEDIQNLESEEYNHNLLTFKLAKQKIEAYLNHLKDKLSIVSYKKANELRTIVYHPNEQYDLFESIQQEINSELPNVNRSTITDKIGEPLLEEFEGFIGESCKNNLVDFTKSSLNQVQIHPNSLEYHFDIMVPYSDPLLHFSGIFFTSFKTDGIREILKQGENRSSKLYLVHNKHPRLIEVSSEGNRAQISRDIYLTEEESSRANIKDRVKLTQWSLYSVPPVECLSGQKQSIIKQGAIKIFLIYLIAITFTVFILKKKKNSEKIISQYIKSLESANKDNEKLSLTDSLTELPNRRSFDERIKVEWARAIRETIPISIIIIDIDFFKQFNDSYGHVMGDECLKKVAHEIALSFNRESDYVARYGGEEFVVILPNCNDIEELVITCNKNIENLKITHNKSNVSKYVTISLGVNMMIPDQNSDVLEFINSADSALYRAKDAGRNQYCFSNTKFLN